MATLVSVEKKLRDTFCPDAEMHRIEKLEAPISRAARLGKAEELVQDALGIIVQLKGEMESWLELMPDNLKEGIKADVVEECIDGLETIYAELEAVDFSTVGFPGMF